MRNITSILITVMSIFTVTILNAQEEKTGLKAKFLMEFGAEWGGDELITVEFTNGNDQTMHAGQGIHLAAGTEISFNSIDALIVRASIGLKWSPTAADDANIAFTRFPLTISPFWQINEDFRIGLGGTYHLGPKFHGDGFVDDIDFSSAFGTRIEIGYKWVAITYTLMNYNSEFNTDVNGNGIGVILSAAIGKATTSDLDSSQKL